MPERYGDLFSLPERLYTEGAPVIISAGSLLRDNETGRIAVQLELNSISQKIINAVKARIRTFGIDQDPLGEVSYEYDHLNIERDEEFGKNFHIAVPNDATQTFTAEVTEVDFADGSIWDMSGTAWEPLPALEPVGDPELVKQYQMRFGKKAQYKPVVYKGIWQCACGGINNEKGYFCHKCGNKKADLLACDLEELATARDQRLAEEKAAAEARAEKAKRAKRILSIVIPAAVLCMAAVLLLTKVIIPNHKYNQAMAEAAALLEAGDYEGAIALYRDLGTQQDGVQIPEEGMEALYAQADKLAQDGKSYEAAALFYLIKDHRDAWERCFELWGEIMPRKTIAAGSWHSVAIRKDGTVVAVGDDGFGQCDVYDWTNVVALAVGDYHTVGLRADGTVVAVGYNTNGQCDVYDWTDVVALAVGDNNTFGLRADGTVVAAGSNDNDQCMVSSWTDIVAIAAGNCSTSSPLADGNVIGLKADGTVVAAGDNGFGQCEVLGWTGIRSIATGEALSFGLKADGTVVTAGLNNDGRCDVYDWTGIVSIAAGLNHTVGLRANGTVVASGSNNYGQCEVDDWKDIVAVEAGYYHTVGLRADGTVVAAGSNNDGQCEVSGWKNIKNIALGNDHTLGLRADGTVVAAGNNIFRQCEVSYLTDIMAIENVDYSKLGLVADGVAVAAENNDNGQNEASGSPHYPEIYMSCQFNAPEGFICTNDYSDDYGHKEYVYHNRDIDMSITVSEESAESYAPAGYQGNVDSWLKKKYEQECAERNVTYDTFSQNWYVVSGYSGDDIFYERTMHIVDRVYEIDFLYPSVFSEKGEKYMLDFLESWSVVSDSIQPGKVSVNADGVNIRSYASTSAPVIKTVKMGDVLSYLGYTATTANDSIWYHIELPNGERGYIASWLCGDPY